MKLFPITICYILLCSSDSHLLHGDLFALKHGWAVRYPFYCIHRVSLHFAVFAANWFQGITPPRAIYVYFLHNMIFY